MIVLLGSSVRAEDQCKTIHCVLRHSAAAGLDEKGSIDVHVTDSDEIEVTITGIGEQEAVFNGTYRLRLMKEDQHAYYYRQSAPFGGVIMWVYFKATNTITYAKLRAFPLGPLAGTPSSYLMIAKCD